MKMKMKLFVSFFILLSIVALRQQLQSLRFRTLWRVRSIGVTASHGCYCRCVSFFLFLSNYEFFVQNGNGWASAATGKRRKNPSHDLWWHTTLYILHHPPSSFVYLENCLLFILVKHVISYDNSKWRAGDFIVHKLFKRCIDRYVAG